MFFKTILYFVPCREESQIPSGHWQTTAFARVSSNLTYSIRSSPTDWQEVVKDCRSRQALETLEMVSGTSRMTILTETNSIMAAPPLLFGIDCRKWLTSNIRFDPILSIHRPSFVQATRQHQSKWTDIWLAHSSVNLRTNFPSAVSNFCVTQKQKRS